MGVGFQHPAAFAPGIGFVGRHDLGKVGAGKAGKTTRGGDRGSVGGVRAGGDATVLGALLAQHTGQLARIDVGDGDHALGTQEIT